MPRGATHFLNWINSTLSMPTTIYQDKLSPSNGWLTMVWLLGWLGLLNTLRPRQNGRHYPEDIFKWIFMSENIWISIKISLKFVARGPVKNIPTLVQIMAWHWPGDKPLSESMMVSLLMHTCITRPQWVKAWYDISHIMMISWHGNIFSVTGPLDSTVLNLLMLLVFWRGNFNICIQGSFCVCIQPMRDDVTL